MCYRWQACVLMEETVKKKSFMDGDSFDLMVETFLETVGIGKEIIAKKS